MQINALFRRHFLAKSTLFRPDRALSCQFSKLGRSSRMLCRLNCSNDTKIANTLLLLYNSHSFLLLRLEIMSADRLIIYHNPRCSKSRETLQILKQDNRAPNIIEYLENPPTKEELRQIISMLGVTPRELLRTAEKAYIDAKLDDSSTDQQILEAICKYPILLQRPIVIAGKQAIFGRPPSKVLEII